MQTAAEEAQKLAAKNALDKLKIILAGGEDAKGRCVKADLGLSPVLEAKRLKARGVDAANPKGRRTFHRLLICRGNDKNDLKWRVLVGGEAGAQFTGDDGTVDEGNDAERLYGLYGTDEKASGPPQFGAGFAINRCVTLTGSTSEPFVKKEDVEKNLAKYIAVAESGDIA